MCSNTSHQEVLDRVAGAGIQVHTIIEDVGQLIREETERTRVKRDTEGERNRMNWESYQR